MASINGFVTLKNGKRISINANLHMTKDPKGKESSADCRVKFKEHFNASSVSVPKTVYEEAHDAVLREVQKILKDLVITSSDPPDFDCIIEYSIDEEDTLWIAKNNKERKKKNLKAIDYNTFEIIMDRLEKQSVFEVKTAGLPPPPDSDDVCCVCNDGDVSNANQIIYCDMCNIAVHQDCYGVPYIPEGAWFCRRCKWSPSQPVKCALCPVETGAFKRTSDGNWVHVVCAIWLNEVHFGNTTFLEPVLGVDKCLEDRKSLRCEYCKIRRGACIQCSNRSCYKAFHVTCAQKAGIGMKIVSDPNNSDLDVQRYVYCFKHIDNNKHMSEQDRTESYKRANRSAVANSSFKPTVNLPRITRAAIDQIKERVNLDNIDGIVKYWFLKRKNRLGAPLIRRLQVEQLSKPKNNRLTIEDLDEKDQSAYVVASRVRQSLETARLLSELVKKREIQKKNHAMRCLEVFIHAVQTPEDVLDLLHEALSEKDTQQVFAEPVNIQGYSTIIKKPMDLSTIKKKCDAGKYTCVADVRTDVILMTDNCSKFNADNAYYLDYGKRFRRAALKVLQDAEEHERQVKEWDLTEEQLLACLLKDFNPNDMEIDDDQMPSTSTSDVKQEVKQEQPTTSRRNTKSKPQKVPQSTSTKTDESFVEVQEEVDEDPNSTPMVRSASRRGKIPLPPRLPSPKKKKDEVKEELDEKPAPVFGQKNSWSAFFGAPREASKRKNVETSDLFSPKRKKVEKKGLTPATSTRSITAFMVPNGQRSTFNSILASPSREGPHTAIQKPTGSRLRNGNNIFDYRENSVKSPMIADTASSEESTDDDTVPQTGDKVTPPAKRTVGNNLNNFDSSPKKTSSRRLRVPKNPQTELEKAREESKSKYAHNALVDADGKAARVISISCMHLEGFTKEKRLAVLQARPQSQNKMTRDEDQILVHLFSDKKELWCPASRVTVLDLTNSRSSNVVGMNKAKLWFQKLTEKK